MPVRVSDKTDHQKKEDILTETWGIFNSAADKRLIEAKAASVS